jgi:hypothetical protein
VLIVHSAFQGVVEVAAVGHIDCFGDRQAMKSEVAIVTASEEVVEGLDLKILGEGLEMGIL